MTILTRRGVLSGLIAAPVVVAADRLMRLRGVSLLRPPPLAASTYMSAYRRMIELAHQELMVVSGYMTGDYNLMEIGYDQDVGLKFVVRQFDAIYRRDF